VTKRIVVLRNLGCSAGESRWLRNFFRLRHLRCRQFAWGLTLLALGAVSLVTGCRAPAEAFTPGARADWLKSWQASNPVWRGVHLSARNDEQLATLGQEFPRLAALGVNVIILEVNFGFDFQSHPELRPAEFITRVRAQDVAKAAREQGIRLIPQLNCLGHQSWGKTTGQLLTKYPQFDETPGFFPGNGGIYCRSWCPQNPGVNPVVFSLIDELIDAFEADAFHVGMDEVFLIGSEHCRRCRGHDPARLFAKAVKDLHGHIVKQRKIEMLMWGDRLLDAKDLGYSEWDAATNRTQNAVNLIPKDIIICDWHYGKRESYPSVPLLLQQGFRVWPSGWQPVEAARALSHYARQQKNPRLMGYLCTTWGKVKIPELTQWPPLTEPIREWQ
jgi:hypothetical protein